MTKKSASRADIPALPTEISKWQRASMDLVQLKFKIHATLSQFSTEERQSDQYKELTDILRGIIVHVIDDHTHDQTTAQPATQPATQAPVQIIQNINTEEDVVNVENNVVSKDSKVNSSKPRWSKYINFTTVMVAAVTAFVTGIIPFIPEILKFIIKLVTGAP